MPGLEEWAKSSYSGCTGSGTHCLEWRKSRYSKDKPCACVEVGQRVSVWDSVDVRDSVDPDGAQLHFAAGQWGRFVDAVKAA